MHKLTQTPDHVQTPDNSCLSYPRCKSILVALTSEPLPLSLATDRLPGFLFAIYLLFVSGRPRGRAFMKRRACLPRNFICRGNPTHQMILPGSWKPIMSKRRARGCLAEKLKHNGVQDKRFTRSRDNMHVSILQSLNLRRPLIPECCMFAK